MYQTHFGLKTRLFDDGVAADAGVFRNRQHTELVEQFKLAFASRTSVIVLRGPAGVGKSTLTSSALRASSTRLALAWLNGTPMNGAELLELLLVELGVNTTRTSRIERLQLWRQFQAEMAATDSRLFVVVERTEDLPVEVLHALDSSTSADAAGHPGANVVLLGHGRIEEHLADPVLDSFRQRIRLRSELKPFTEAELQDYLRHHVAVAGGEYDRVFALGAVAALHRYSRGVARLTNNLCETALTLAASRSQKLLTVDLVNEAAVAWLGLSEPQPVGVPSVASTTPVATKPTAPARPPITVAAPIVVTAPSAPVATTAPAATVAPATPAAPVASATRTAGTASVAPFTSRAPAAPPVPPPRPAEASMPVSPPVPPAPPVVTPAAAPPPAPRAIPPVNAAPPKPAPPVAQEFDGGATDIPDVSIVDFPVLTDAIDADGPRTTAPAPVVAATPPKPAPKAPAAPVAAPSAPTPARTAAPAAPPPAPPAARPTSAPAAAAAPSAKAATPAAPAPKAAPPAAPVKPAAAAPVPAPTPAKPAAASAPSKAAPPPAPEPQEEDDQLRQTQTMRAISEAKSIVDISDSMAETLFGDAELDFLSTSLAAGAGWKEPDAAPAAAAAKAPAAAAQPKPAKAASSEHDDLLDLLGLADAPLELIDDSAQPPADPARKSGTQH